MTGLQCGKNANTNKVIPNYICISTEQKEIPRYYNTHISPCSDYLELYEQYKFPSERSALKCKISVESSCCNTVHQKQTRWKDFYHFQEIGSFLMDLLKVNQDINISDAELLKMVDEVIKNFDDNNDGKTEIEIAKSCVGICVKTNYKPD